MPFGSRRFFGSNIRPGASALPADITITNSTFETTAKFGTHSLSANVQTGGVLDSQCQITVYPKDRDFFINSDHAWTVEWWCRLTDSEWNDVGDAAKFLNLGPESLNNGTDPFFFVAQPGDGGDWRFNLVSGSVGWLGLGITQDQWYHFAIVSNGTADSTTGVLKFYANGSQVTFASADYNYNDAYVRPTNRNVNFGMYDPQTVSNFTGGCYYDEIRISNIARYTSSFTPSTSAFVSDENTLALFHFDNNLIDSSAEGL